MERSDADVVCAESAKTARTIGSTCNNLDNPAWGTVGVRFAGNIDPATLPQEVSDAEIFDPNPRTISRELRTRDEFIPVEQFNLLATAWIQFMVHDWCDHGENMKRNAIKVDIAADNPDFGKSKMIVRRIKRDKTYDKNFDKVITYRNEVTHWWDGSQIYGSDAETIERLKTFEDGQMIMYRGPLPKTRAAKVRTGFNSNDLGRWFCGFLYRTHKLP